MRQDKPPGFWISFQRWFCPPYLYEGIEGDLLEHFDKEVQTRGLRRARWRFAWHVIRFCRIGIILRNKLVIPKLATGMLRNYFKVAWRNMAANRTYTIINLTGLTLGLTVSILLFWIVRFEYNFDRYHKNADRLYQIKSRDKFGEANSHVPQGVIYSLRNNFPEVENAASVYRWDPQVVSACSVWSLLCASDVQRKFPFERFSGLPYPMSLLYYQKILFSSY